MVRKYVLALVMGFMLVAAIYRATVSGWGPPSGRVDPAAPVSYGFGTRPEDNLAYTSFAQQARLGHGRFEDLYTTTPHERLVFNLFFLAVGRLSALFSISPIPIFNVLALLAIPVFILCVVGMCRIVGLAGHSVWAVTCLALGGGGISWVRSVAGDLGLRDTAWIGRLGPDFEYIDLYPAINFILFPYHAVSLAGLAGLVLLIVHYERAARGFRAKDGLLLTGCAFLIVSARPYEPAMVLASYALLTLASFGFGAPQAIRKRRAAISGWLAAGIVPMMIYARWVSSHGVWVEFTRMTLDIRMDDAFNGFALLWLLAIAGAYGLGRRWLDSPYGFFVIWASGCLLLLIVFGSGYTKLCGGCTIPLALLCGPAIRPWEIRIQDRRAGRLAFGLLAVLALASPAAVIAWSFRDGKNVRVSSELFQALDAIRADATTDPAVVLTDPNTGTLLPGLGGMKVFCGHWSLTERYYYRVAILIRMGFTAERTRMTEAADLSRLRPDAVLLMEQIEAGLFRYLLLRRDSELYATLGRDHRDSIVVGGPEYALWKMSAPIAETLVARLRIIASGGVVAVVPPSSARAGSARTVDAAAGDGRIDSPAQVTAAGRR
jgi:hypothetical protein